MGTSLSGLVLGNRLKNVDRLFEEFEDTMHAAFACLPAESDHKQRKRFLQGLEHELVSEWSKTMN